MALVIFTLIAFFLARLQLLLLKIREREIVHSLQHFGGWHPSEGGNWPEGFRYFFERLESLLLVRLALFKLHQLLKVLSFLITLVILQSVFFLHLNQFLSCKNTQLNNQILNQPIVSLFTLLALTALVLPFLGNVEPEGQQEALNLTQLSENLPLGC